MHRSSTVLLCYGAIPELDEASIRPTRDPPPGRAGDWADAMLLLVQDRDRIAGLVSIAAGSGYWRDNAPQLKRSV